MLSRNHNAIILLIIILINILLRYPVVPHEIGADSFYIHSLANSISEFGFAKWWIHPLSIVGMYPYSYASSVPFILSGISQTSGINMERIILIFSLFLGLLSVFTSYLMAGVISDNKIFQFIVALGYSTSECMLYLTSWTTSTRGLFIALLPLLFYLFMKKEHSRSTYCIFFIFLFLLLTTHNLVFFLVPILFAYIVSRILSRYKERIDKIPKTIQMFIILFFSSSIFIFTIFYPFPLKNISGIELFTEIILTYSRYIGILGIFSVVGYLYLLSIYNKNFAHRFLLLCLLSLTPILYIHTYSKYFILPLVFLLVGLGFLKLVDVSIKRKFILPIIMILLITSIFVSGFYQFWQTNIENKQSYIERYLGDSTYHISMWVNNFTDEPIVCGYTQLGWRVLAISEQPVLTGETPSLVYGFINKSELIIERRSLLSSIKWKGSLFKEKKSSVTWHYYKLLATGADDKQWGQKIIEKYNLRYEISNEVYYDKFGFYNSKLSESLPINKNNLYDNGKQTLWDLGDFD